MSDEATDAHTAFDTAADRITQNAARQGAAPACTKGCAACCYTLVSLMPQEVFALAHHIAGLSDEERGAIRALVLEHAAVHGEKDGEARITERIPCPFLDPVSLTCRIYEARPLTCRGMNATDATPCKQALAEGDASVPLPTLLALHEEVQARYDALGAAAEDAGRAAAAVELSQALATVWMLEDAEARWRAGEDIFAHCRTSDIESAVPRFDAQDRGSSGKV